MNNEVDYTNPWATNSEMGVGGWAPWACASSQGFEQAHRLAQSSQSPCWSPFQKKQQHLCSILPDPGGQCKLKNVKLLGVFTFDMGHSQKQSALKGALPAVLYEESTPESTLESTPTSKSTLPSALRSAFGAFTVLDSLGGHTYLTQQ